jgi:hypothetical protein
MTSINYIIGESNFEQVRRAVAVILAYEIANQKNLINNQLLIETDPEIINSLEFQLSCLPNKVYEERFLNPVEDEIPILNISIVSNSLDEVKSATKEQGILNILIEGWQSAETDETNRGDTLATQKLHRMLWVVNAIIQNPIYYKLGLVDNIIGWRQTSNMRFGRPTWGADNFNNDIYGQLDLNVKIMEIHDNRQLELIDGIDTLMNTGKDEFGMFWISNFN